MERESQTLLLGWALGVLTAAVALAMTDAPTAVMVARATCVLRRLDAKAASWRHGTAAGSRDG
jgi:hypothetical protein